MLRLKRFNESQSTFLTDRDQIKKWCDSVNILNYQIDDDGTVNVDGSVSIMREGLGRLPVKFGTVSQQFSANFCGLTTLEGFPHTVWGSLSIAFNKLTSLEGCTKKVGVDFNCVNNKLTSLEGGPERVNRAYICNSNKLTSFKGVPEKVVSLYANKNKIRNLEYCPEISRDLQVGYNLLSSLEGCPQNLVEVHCNFNNLTNLVGLPKELSILLCSCNLLTSMEGCPKKVINMIDARDNYYLVNPKGLEGFSFENDVSVLNVNTILFSDTPLFNLMKQFMTIGQFIESLDYYYFRMVDGIPSVIGFRLDEALEEFGFERKPLLSYRVVDENLKEIEPMVKEDFEDE